MIKATAGLVESVNATEHGAKLKEESKKTFIWIMSSSVVWDLKDFSPYDDDDTILMRWL